MPWIIIIAERLCRAIPSCGYTEKVGKRRLGLPLEEVQHVAFRQRPFGGNLAILSPREPEIQSERWSTNQTRMRRNPSSLHPRLATTRPSLGGLFEVRYVRHWPVKKQDQCVQDLRWIIPFSTAKMSPHWFPVVCPKANVGAGIKRHGYPCCLALQKC